jgi:hypothetical protein
MSRQITSSISNLDLTGLLGCPRWSTHEIQEKNYRKFNSGWVKIPLEKSIKMIRLRNHDIDISS